MQWRQRSHRFRCPPRAAVRQRAIAIKTLTWGQCSEAMRLRCDEILDNEDDKEATFADRHYLELFSQIRN